MDFGHTYANPAGLRAMLYVEPHVTVPERLELSIDGKPVVLSRLAPRSLECFDVAGVSGHCTNRDCHRMPLGECRCGRHTGRVSFSRAVEQ